MQSYSCLLFCNLAKNVSVQEFYHEKVLSCQESYMAQGRGGVSGTLIEMDLSYNHTASSAILVTCRFSLDSCYSEAVFITSYLCYWLKSKAVEYRKSTREANLL